MKLIKSEISEQMQSIVCKAIDAIETICKEANLSKEDRSEFLEYLMHYCEQTSHSTKSIEASQWVSSFLYWDKK